MTDALDRKYEARGPDPKIVYSSWMYCTMTPAFGRGILDIPGIRAWSLFSTITYLKIMKEAQTSDSDKTDL